MDRLLLVVLSCPVLSHVFLVGFVLFVVDVNNELRRRCGNLVAW